MDIVETTVLGLISMFEFRLLELDIDELLSLFESNNLKDVVKFLKYNFPETIKLSRQINKREK